ncbi:glycogen branching enzyme [Desulfocucumis palustris]|uniref:Glycogen branching enzyme n=1 Tax=Desulfocucumis palustris TaxID=1898651 RepID=A0A2L2XFK5_9FIRM|nr:1,4-alpha-glucan branching protein domain-containing protein [Desulfocucumis palustris]GBF34473.1 glycogen branching enzyme [Desulfocucumis palustris]
MPRGYLSLVLHAHLPYVRDPENEDALEERWLFEAITTCYIPLLNSMLTMSGEGVEFRLTISLSPPLLSMLTDNLLQQRYLAYIDKMIGLGKKECHRNSGDPIFLPLAELYLRRAEGVRDFFLQYQGDLTLPFKKLMLEGRVELITTCATHGYLPLIKRPEARRAQIHNGVEIFNNIFGKTPPGFWLPECGYIQGVDELLKEYGVAYFFVDTHGILGAGPRPEYGIYAPLHCRSGVAAFGRDPESSRQVWERRIGYPGHPDYREFYRDIGYDLDMDYLKPSLPGGIRVDTGFKYYRITGDGADKKPYAPRLAETRAAEHAAHFLQARLRQFETASVFMEDRLPLVVSPYDAELFGHWWYEGPVWLENLCRQSASGEGMEMITPGDYLGLYPENQEAELPMSSWGEEGYSFVWLNPENDWIYRHQHRAEAKMTELADLYPGATGPAERALNQAGRELLLAQSSDWAFILKQKTTVQYAASRVKMHLANFNKLVEQIEALGIDEQQLIGLERRNNIFPSIDYRVFGYNRVCPEIFRDKLKRVLLLSWEYPPRTVGGLSRHVYDLSGALASLGLEVHVLTCPAAETPLYQFERGVHVHRVNPDELPASEFLEWLQQLNAGMVGIAEEIGLGRGYFDLIHAHDWLVRDAAETMASGTDIPLVVTIHATEYGRNRGLFSDLQKSINSIENSLVNRADRVICCSSYMAREVSQLFGAGPDKIRVIANGVNMENLVIDRGQAIRCNPEGKGNIIFLGRLVPEKGLQILLEAFPLILREIPEACLLVAGRGPYEEELKQKARDLGIDHRVKFVGFVDDTGRNRILAGADLAVFPSIYEPFGIVALEAMAAGVPMIVSDTGGLGEIIEHGVEGYKVPPGRADLLASFACELLINEELARKFSLRAMKKVLTRYDWKHIAYETGRVYLEALAEHGALR